MRKYLLAIALLLQSNLAYADYTILEWGIDKTTSPYKLGAKINNSWTDLSTINSSGVWGIPATNISGAFTGITVSTDTTSPTTDGAAVVSQNSSTTAFQIYSPMIPPGYYFYGVTRSVLNLQSGTTVQHGAAYDAFTYNNVAQGTAPSSKNAVGLFVTGVNATNNAASWGINTACADTQTNTNYPTLTGVKCIGWEADFQVNNSSIIEGAAFIIQGPGTPAGANGVQVSAATGAGNNARWTNAFVVDAGSASVGSIYGAASSGTSVNAISIPIFFSIRDSVGAGHNISIKGIPFGTDSAIQISDINRANGLILTNAASGNYPVIGSAGTDANIHLALAGKGTGSILANSPLKVNNSIYYQVTTLPSNPVEGQCSWDSTVHKLKCYDGSTWQSAW